MKLTVLHNPRCRKSREALSILEAANKQYDIREYLKNPLSRDELIGILKKLNLRPVDIIRKGEKVFKERFKGKQLTDDQWVDALVEYPILIERPIVIADAQAVVGRPPENIQLLLA